jgi:hypothetical protein
MGGVFGGCENPGASTINHDQASRRVYGERFAQDFFENRAGLFAQSVRIRCPQKRQPESFLAIYRNNR